jgi:hypothetical protein
VGRLPRLVHRALSGGSVTVVGTLQRCPPVVEQGDALLDALERVGHVALEADQDPDGVLVSAAPDLVGIAMGIADDRPALRVGRLGQPALVDQEGGLLLCPGDDALGLVLGLLDDPFALGIDPLGGTNLFGDSDAQLIDEAEGRVLVDDDVGGERQLLAVRDQRFEALDEEDDVDRSVLQADEARYRVAQADSKYRTAASDVRGSPARSACPVGAVRSISAAAIAPSDLDQPPGRTIPSAATAAAGTIVETSPPKLAISLTRLELM